jgi:uncharacterized protein YdcH (DUF465 family)
MPMPKVRTVSPAPGTTARLTRSNATVLIEEHAMKNTSIRLLAYRLLERHQKLDDALRRAQARRFVDPFEVVRLKKLKLVIKDRLARMMRIAQPRLA